MTRKETKTGKELERRVADAYRKMGAWKVEHDVELAGNQIDVYVELEAPGHLLHRIAVEAKDRTRPVGIKIVNDFAQIVNLLRRAHLIDEGIIVSATGFSKQARNAAQTYGIRLLEEADLGAIVAEAKAAEAEGTKEKEEGPVQPPAQVTLLLDEINSFGISEREYLVGVLAEALRLEREQIRVVRVESGSVRVTLELPAEAATNLARMIESGELDLTSVFQKWAAAQAILAKCNGKRVMKNKPNKPPQFFVYKGKPCYLPKEAAKLLDEKGIKIERLESEEWFILDEPYQGAGIGGREEMKGILKEMRREEAATRADIGQDEEHLRELILTKRRRLHELELQAAKFGISTPPHIAIEIEDLRREIAEFEAQLKS